MAARTKKLTDKDIVWQRIHAPKKKEYLVTSDQARSEYTLWELDKANKAVPIRTAPTPAGFLDEISW